MAMTTNCHVTSPLRRDTLSIAPHRMFEIEDRVRVVTVAAVAS